jgi:hypothetical protein
MPRNVEDIVPPKRTIRDIPLPENRRRDTPREPIKPARPERVQNEEPMRITDDVPAAPPPMRKEFIYNAPPPNRKRFYIWTGGVVGVIVIGLAIFSLFGGATLTYVPRVDNLTFDQDIFPATKDADTADGKLPYSVIQLSGDKSAQAPASGSTQVSVKAQGTILVYNTGSTAQKLIATTRFATSDGKIYRTPTALNVPAKGQITATIVADQPGADYNIDLSDFTIPGLKGSPQYSAVYGRSQTAMTGGFVGTQGKVSSDDLTKAKTLLDSALHDDLVAQAQAQVPADYVLFSNLTQISYGALSTSSSTDTTAVVSEHGDFIGAIFKKSDLAAYLATQKLQNAPTGPAEITNWNGLSVTASSTKLDLANSTTINFQISGAANLLWDTNEPALAQDLAGKNKSDLSTILKNYPSIVSASAMIRPFWKSVFPSDPAKIKIVVNGSK